ncbi:CLK4-associating serine/arginine rich protein-like [Sycon ciliatum]|uniref:CLK4-associating serine/arginine rich protein-like n=1 Tax=Sycon ciliatum TaxID=27933 RepID=UPI0031F71B4E
MPAGYEYDLYIRVEHPQQCPALDQLGRIVCTVVDGCLFRRTKHYRNFGPMKRDPMVALEVLVSTAEDSQRLIKRLHRATLFEMKWIVQPFRAYLINEQRSWTTINRVFLKPPGALLALASRNIDLSPMRRVTPFQTDKRNAAAATAAVTASAAVATVLPRKPPHVARMGQEPQNQENKVNPDTSSKSEGTVVAVAAMDTDTVQASHVRAATAASAAVSRSKSGKQRSRSRSTESVTQERQSTQSTQGTSPATVSSGRVSSRHSARAHRRRTFRQHSPSVPRSRHAIHGMGHAIGHTIGRTRGSASSAQHNNASGSSSPRSGNSRSPVRRSLSRVCDDKMPSASASTVTETATDCVKEHAISTPGQVLMLTMPEEHGEIHLTPAVRDSLTEEQHEQMSAIQQSVASALSSDCQYLLSACQAALESDEEENGQEHAQLVQQWLLEVTLEHCRHMKEQLNAIAPGLVADTNAL